MDIMKKKSIIKQVGNGLLGAAKAVSVIGGAVLTVIGLVAAASATGKDQGPKS